MIGYMIEYIVIYNILSYFDLILFQVSVGLHHILNINRQYHAFTLGTHLRMRSWSRASSSQNPTLGATSKHQALYLQTWSMVCRILADGDQRRWVKFDGQGQLNRFQEPLEGALFFFSRVFLVDHKKTCKKMCPSYRQRWKKIFRTQRLHFFVIFCYFLLPMRQLLVKWCFWVGGLESWDPLFKGDCYS